jgi:hypothetical protein
MARARILNKNDLLTISRIRILQIWDSKIQKFDLRAFSEKL